jgi:RNA polymerase sigma-70 factor (ECF subfamily)
MTLNPEPQANGRGPQDPGDSVAWVVAAIARFERPLTQYVSRILHDHERARDVVQDAFLRLCLQRRDDVEPHLAEWLYTVCRNRAMDVRRKEQRNTGFSDLATENHPSDQPAPDQAIEQREESARATRLMGDLSDNQQEVLRLKFQHDLSYKQISRITNLSVSNVGFLIHTGLKILRQRMEQNRAPHGE